MTLFFYLIYTTETLPVLYFISIYFIFLALAVNGLSPNIPFFRSRPNNVSFNVGETATLFCSVSDLQTRFVSTSTSYYVVDDFYSNVANDDIRFLLLLHYSLSVFFFTLLGTWSYYFLILLVVCLSFILILIIGFIVMSFDIFVYGVHNLIRFTTSK